jgi:hypothetical protein
MREGGYDVACPGEHFVDVASSRDSLHDNCDGCLT